MWWLLARIAISGGLLAWLVHRINLGAIGANLVHASPGWVLAANLLTAPVIVLVSWKWQVLLRAAGVRESLPRLVRMNLVGGFYSLVLPGEETGQLAKGLILARHSKGDAVAASIIVDEILGTLSIFGIALVALGLTHPFPLRGLIAGAIGFMLAVFLVLLVLAVFPQFHGLARAIVERILNWLRLYRMQAWLAPFWASLNHYYRRPGPLLAAFAITVAAHLLADVSVLSTMRAVGANVSFLDICWVVAAISALVTIPITVSGFGIREGANVIILGQLGVPGSQALAISLLAFAIGLVWSLPGALLQFGIRSKTPDRPSIEPEEPAAVEVAAGNAAS
ncbi:MAG: lysylphosphatidylglycerol synthase transmembrane domain-containing protein [Chloroflexota bacterium]